MSRDMGFVWNGGTQYPPPGASGTGLKARNFYTVNSEIQSFYKRRAKKSEAPDLVNRLYGPVWFTRWTRSMHDHHELERRPGMPSFNWDPWSVWEIKANLVINSIRPTELGVFGHLGKTLVAVNNGSNMRWRSDVLPILGSERIDQMSFGGNAPQVRHVSQPVGKFGIDLSSHIHQKLTLSTL
ncbi:hypothetical protein DFH28DRAFT_1112947 [Melampsora americana]|nr:hypothetical protein DFH28DRAFT_1112947 [Melampsora americana]